MKAGKWGELSFETFALGRVLSVLPDDLPSIREARIQASKLSRMVEKEYGSYKKHEAGFKVLAGGSLRKLAKEEGRRAQQAGQQTRKVRALCDKVFKEFLCTNNPRLSNVEYRHWRKQFDLGMTESSRKFLKGVAENVSKRIIEGMS